ncbi:uncharacterized protein LOC141812457 [Curcuma longa]|uniref:uncharacterized protein LOC141812457 n=1 Tax=Curcuma longa TaxID=136217 RepID=UPI003D9EE51F
MYYPQGNGQTEVMNRELVRGLKIKLDHIGGSWVEELHDILWAYQTTPRDNTGLTPFHLVYGSEVVVPVEIGCHSTRIEAYKDAEDNAHQRAAELDLITEIRDKVNTCLFAFRQWMIKLTTDEYTPDPSSSASSFGKSEDRWKEWAS